MNKVIITGRMTADPELRQVGDDNISLLRMNIAVRRNFKNSDGEYDTDFIPVVFWRNNAEFVSNYGAKGRMIGITGRLEVRSYEDEKYTDEDGNAVTRFVTEVIADDVEFLDKRQDNDDTDEGEVEETEAAPPKATKPVSKKTGTKNGVKVMPSRSHVTRQVAPAAKTKKRVASPF
ncbi:Single-stranded DNA-binding protein [Moorella thermoacetica]|uniref:Single-stranded DNA-binding protein n=1 Tax=Neomoorella thermoacetica TaxID=1525 RepID=A0AAC9HK78_NEOTH|nr:single-stranded DNA-binding protein [Moorella thermoacetica]AOQ24621.1 Single-stranded DNA-binding protein SsbB [Moorella thermoacetica]TYL12724.1 Single-stranded DNA-binding protein [Moorella thermoacetica]